MPAIRIWLPLIVALLLNATANVMLKVGSKAAKPLGAEASFAEKFFNFLNPITIVAIGLFAANIIAYRKALDGLSISVAYPIMVSSGLVLVTLAAAMLPVLNERISLVQIAGMALIGIGVWMVTAG